MVQRAYAHLGEVRHRSKTVEHCIEQHKERLKKRISDLGLSPLLSPRSGNA